LQADREEKIAQIHQMRGRIARLLEQDPAISGGEDAKQLRLLSMRRHLEELKIRADINDPLVKKRYEDGNGRVQMQVLYESCADAGKVT
jgi:large subunit ribosomal protein L35